MVELENRLLSDLSEYHVKAALLLTLALTKTSNVDEIQRMFDEY
jgi:hypothetical protein